MDFFKNLWKGFYNCMHAAIWILLLIGGILALFLAGDFITPWPIILRILGVVFIAVGIIGLAAIGAGLRVLDAYMGEDEENNNN